MSSPPSDMSLEGLIEDRWDDRAVDLLLPLLEPYREEVEEIARRCDASQSWRDYRHAVWSPVPDHVSDDANEILDREAARTAGGTYAELVGEDQ